MSGKWWKLGRDPHRADLTRLASPYRPESCGGIIPFPREQRRTAPLTRLEPPGYTPSSSGFRGKTGRFRPRRRGKSRRIRLTPEFWSIAAMRPSGLSQLDFGVDGLEFATSVVDLHLPVDAPLDAVEVG